MAQRTKTNPAVDELERALENALEFAFRPVGPRQEYTDRLRSRLMEEPDYTLEDGRLVELALGGVGVVSVLLLIVASVRWVQHRRRR